LDLLSQTEQAEYPLLQMHPVKKMLVILVSSNRALCGSYNANLFRKTRALLRDLPSLAQHHVPIEVGEDEEKNIVPTIELVGVGKKSADFARRNNLTLSAVFDAFGDRPRFEDILALSRMAIEGYANGTYQKVLVAYTDYRSSLVQEPRMRQLLPIHVSDVESLIQELSTAGHIKDKKTEEKPIALEEYVVEPGLHDIIVNILPRLVEVQLYQTILESLASEHSARMLAMRNASEAAQDMIRALQLAYNKARQAGITQEISEIVGGAAALE
jgi:F-type H+-transporting ATPase subunit gamma